MKLLFVDDIRMPADCALYMYKYGVNCNIYREEWNIVRSYKQFVNWIEENGLPDFISFDHDLADDDELKEELAKEEWFNVETDKEYIGMDCAKWLVDYCLDNDLPLPEFAVHSSNPCGVDNINGILKSYNKFYNSK